MAKGKKKKVAPGDVATNRQAAFRYHLSDNLEAGMVLKGTEVKSLRGGKAQIKDGYVALTDGELFLHNVHIPPYENAARDNHEPERVRKLLAKRSEIDKLRIKVAERGFTIVPLRIYFSDGKAKVEIALGRGKDQGDKRRAIKDRDMKRDVERALAER
ncbi:MAG: SsrA-binding protein [Solirubrobacteraceae bacterium]|jgi:SsrA-binding protein|nr:SsrA-binding protein [Solirubrobacteraceae bacterium]